MEHHSNAVLNENDIWDAKQIDILKIETYSRRVKEYEEKNQ